MMSEQRILLLSLAFGGIACLLAMYFGLLPVDKPE